MLTILMPCFYVLALTGGGANNLVVEIVNQQSLSHMGFDASSQLVRLENGHFLVAYYTDGKLRELDEDGNVLKSHYPNSLEKGYIIRSITMLDDGTPIAVFRHLTNSIFVTGFDESFQLVNPREHFIRASNAPAYEDLRLSPDGSHFIALNLAFYSAEDSLRTVMDSWLNADFEPLFEFSKRVEGALLSTRPSEANLVSFFHERLKGYFAPRTALGFLPDNTIVAITPGEQTIQRYSSPDSPEYLTDLPQTSRMGAIDPPLILNHFKDKLVLYMPKLASRLTSDWFDSYESVWLGDSFDEPLAWAIFPLGKDWFGVVTDFNMQTLQQTLTIFDQEGQWIGHARGEGLPWMTLSRQQRFHVSNGDIYTLTTHKDGQTFLTKLRIRGLPL